MSTLRLSVGFGDTFGLVFLFNGIRVGGTLGSVDDLISQALGDGLDVAEGGGTGASGKKVDGLVDTAERGDVDGLATDNTGRTDACGVFACTGIDNGVDEDLDWVLVGEEVNDLERGTHDLDGKHLFTSVASVKHECAYHTFHNWAVGFAETHLSIASSSVGKKDFFVDGSNVVSECKVIDLKILVGPLSEEHRGG